MKLVHKVSALCIVISLLILSVPFASAADEDQDPVVYDLLASSSYNRLWDGEIVYSDLSPDRGSTSYVGGAWVAGLSWYHPQSFSYSRCFITIQASRVPYALTFERYIGSPVVYCNYVGSSGDYHQYYIDFSGSTAEINISAHFADIYYGTYEVISAYIVRSFTSPVNNVDLRINRHQLTTGTGYWTYANVYDLENFWIPNGYFGTYARTESTRADHITFSVTIDPDDRSVDYADSLEFIIQHFGLMYDVGLQVCSSPTSAPAYVLYPDSYDLTQSPREVSYGYSAVVHTYVSSFKFDLSGIDLKDKYLLFTGKVNLDNIGVTVDDAGNVIQRDGWEFRIFSCGFNLPVESPAWYEIFWWRLGGALANMSASVQSGFDSMGDKFDAFIHGSDADNATSNQFKEEVDQQVDSFEAANDTLTSVEKPSADSINSSPEAILDPAGMALLTQPLNNLFGNELILSILLISATCALIGYIFFGKR